MFPNGFPERSRVRRDEKLTVGVGGMKGSWENDNRISDKEGSMFVSCSQSEALLRSTPLISRCCSKGRPESY